MIRPQKAPQKGTEANSLRQKGTEANSLHLGIGVCPLLLPLLLSPLPLGANPL
jgi:hypothetical protein